MSDENGIGTEPRGQENNQGQSEAVTFEDVAREIGWVPKEDFKGNPDKWTDAKTWVKLNHKINNEHFTEIRNLKKTIDGMAKVHKSSVEAAYKRGIEEAQAARREAIKAGDVEEVEKIDQQIESMKQQVTPEAGKLLPEVEKFITRHADWWDKDKVMTADALDYKERYIRANPGATIDDVLDYVEAKIRKDYPEKFSKAASAAEDNNSPAAVEGSRPGNSGKPNPIAKIKAHIYADPDLKRVAKQFTESGYMKEEEYFNSLLQLPEYAHFNK